MYLQRFGLQREPFSIAPDPHTLFLSERHREALAHLLYGAQAGGGFVLLTGSIGAGKTTVCRAFLERLPANCRVAYVFNPQLSSRELLQTICDEFGIALPSPPPRSAKGYLDPLNRFLLERHAAGDHCLLVIDEAQRLDIKVLEQLRLLTNLETATRKLLQIMLIGQPELRSQLARPELEQLAQRVIARYHLEGLSVAETGAYVEHRLAVAGWQGEPLLDAAQLRLLHRLSAGIPRRINLLADRLLLALYARGQRRASRRLLREVAAELRGELPQQVAPKRIAAWLGGGLLMGAALAWAISSAWQQPAPNSDAAAVAEASRASAKVLPAAQPSTKVPAASVPAASTPAASVSRLPEGFASRFDALPALATLWQQEASPQLCQQAEAGLRCWSSRLSLPALQALNRPGVLTLVEPGGLSQTLLLLRIDGTRVTLQGPAGEPQQLSLLDFAQAWTGELLTVWRPPPGLPAGERVPRASRGPVGRWLDQQLDAAAAPALPSRAERIAAFQRAEGLRADGEPGPLTLMRLAQRADAREPRLAER